MRGGRQPQAPSRARASSPSCPRMEAERFKRPRGAGQPGFPLCRRASAPQRIDELGELRVVRGGRSGSCSSRRRTSSSTFRLQLTSGTRSGSYIQSSGRENGLGSRGLSASCSGGEGGGVDPVLIRSARHASTDVCLVQPANGRPGPAQPEPPLILPLGRPGRRVAEALTPRGEPPVCGCRAPPARR